MTLSSVLLLTRPEFRGLDVRLEDGCEEVLMIWEKAALSGQAGDLVSLLALDGPAEGVETENLYYPLAGETLYPTGRRHQQRHAGRFARIRLQRGRLICVTRRCSKSEMEADEAFDFVYCLPVGLTGCASGGEQPQETAPAAETASDRERWR